MEKPSIGNIQQNSRISAKLHEEEVNSKRASGWALPCSRVFFQAVRGRRVSYLSPSQL